MTLYVGEIVTLSHTATYDGTSLSGAGGSFPNGITTYIDIWNVDSTHMLGASMTWSAGNARWEYHWDTSGLAAGKYTCKVWVYGGTLTNWEYFTVSLKADKIPGGGS